MNYRVALTRLKIWRAGGENGSIKERGRRRGRRMGRRGVGGGGGKMEALRRGGEERVSIKERGRIKWKH